MDTKTAIFYVFSVILLFSAFRVITARSTVHSALFLVLAFFNAAGVWMLLQAEFLAISLVLVYVGAVMVLFLFVVMMLDFNVDAVRQNFWKHFPVAGLIGAVIALEMAVVLLGGFKLVDAPQATAQAVQMGNTRLLGIELYKNYLYPLEVAAVILLVAIVAAIALTMRKRKDSRYIDPADQIKVKKGDRLRIVQMPVEVETPAAAGGQAEASTGGQA
ncbi:NADH-quinone oxidoreductase subunit J [Caldimonas brevitalea]|uniref:NADH-quinone oxidoreductase subunit J n=1 Tax=Caldimonas brevitalea TaxID=413882 RepID=A0A0G3BM56_9BURK|nr:NADH-quinone oxidoreductase subunit J [Caldimonas brevitalea]AKJ28436.1 NADH:ubiquinone oxidoreductase subunit J [Caldimonas brevitalea]